MKRLIVVAAAILVLVAGAGAATLAGQDTQTVTVTVPYTVGDQTGQVVVSKDVLVPTVTVTQTVTETVPSPPAPSVPLAPANLRVTAQDQTSVSIAWDASDGATNYHIYRDGVLIGQGPGSSGGFENVWVDAGRTCGTSYQYSVDAENSNGTSPKASVTAATTACDPAPPPPPPTSTQMTPAQFRTACAAGPVSNVEVTGSVSLPVNCHATNIVFDGGFTLADGVVIKGCTATSFSGTNGSSNWTIDSCVFDGKGKIANNMIYDSNGKIPKNWHILNSTFKNFYIDDGSTHSEALFIGYSDGGEIRGNTFTNNGNTGHIFFTWWGGVANPKTSYARNICVAGNTFNATHGAYYDVNFRDEIPTSANIKIQRDASTGWPQFYGDC